MKKTLAMITALAITASAMPANAGTVEVSYADLNLASPEGQARLEKRVEKAAREVCELDVRQTGTLLRTPEAISCFKAAKAQAHEQFAAIMERHAKGG